MTIYIDKNDSNTCIFTLNESVTISNPNFILQIESKVNLKSKIMWLNNDISLNPMRYNEFIINEVNKIDEDLEDMKVFLNEPSYNWYVWQTESTNLSLSDATSIIESGKIIVKK